MPAARPTFRIELEALPGAVPAVLRLRRLLKFALRACGLRCRRAEEVTGPQEEREPSMGSAAVPAEGTGVEERSRGR